MNQFIVAFTALAATTALSTPTSTQAYDFKIVGNADQVRQIQRSLSACPNLGRTLDSLTKSTEFRQVRVTKSGETKRVGPFLAAISGSEIILADDWLELQSQPYFDVRHAGEILPDNLCFDLGHLSDHIAHPPSLSPVGVSMEVWLGQRLKAESLAFIRGWPFVLEAARMKNHGRPLSPAQVGDLLLNLRYRFAFLQAISPQAVSKLNILPDGSIPETDANVVAVQQVLSHSTIADLQ